MATAYELIQAELLTNLDRPAKLGRFEIFQQAVQLYMQESKTRWPENGHGVFLIAGTNGKGSVAKTIETVLTREGHSVGLYTSPHLMETTERIHSHGKDLTEDEFVEIYRFLTPYRQRFDLSHFEILTLMMIETFFGGRTRARVSHAVIEVGVGGRLDPTRVVPHEIAVVTRIGLDHEAILGPLLSIAREKFAVAEGSRVLVYAPPETTETERALSEARRTYSEVLFEIAPIYPFEIELTDGEPAWKLKTISGDAGLSLLGDRAAFNSSVAMKALEVAGIASERILSGLAHVRWPARMERLEHRGRTLYLSGDHNPQGIESLRSLLNEFRFEKLWLVVGVGKNKPLDEMLGLYFSFPSEWKTEIILTTTVFRALKVDDYGQWAKRARAVVPDALEALEYAVTHAGVNDLIVVSGSLYLVGDLRRRLISRSR